MEYNEFITRVRQAQPDSPDTDTILAGMRRTLHRRQQRHRAILSAVFVLAVGSSVLFMQPRYGSSDSPTLAETVSLRIDAPPTNTPAPVAGYRHSIYNRQIYTLL